MLRRALISYCKALQFCHDRGSCWSQDGAPFCLCSSGVGPDCAEDLPVVPVIPSVEPVSSVPWSLILTLAFLAMMIVILAVWFGARDCADVISWLKRRGQAKKRVPDLVDVEIGDPVKK